MSKQKGSAAAIAIAVIAIAVLGVAIFGFTRNEGNFGASTENYVNTAYNDGLHAKKFSQGGGVLRFTATTTQGARTLTQAELADNSVIEILATSSPALVLTLPATSTLTTLLPNAGDSRTWFIDNQQAAATTTTIAAGTGIDLVAYTTNDDVIDGLEISQLTCWRKVNRDVYCLTTEILKAD